MPEGHTVHRCARCFGDRFTGPPLAVTSPQGRFSAGAALLDGRAMTSAHAVGKQLFCGFGDRWLHVHLGLYGAWQYGGSAYDGPASLGAPRRPGPGDPATVRVRLVARVAAGERWAELRGASRCEVLTDDERTRLEAALGPDPLGTDRAGDTGAAAERRFARRVATRRAPIGALLLDQGVVAGVGNVYRAEALFRAGIVPSRPGVALTADETHALWGAVVRQLRAGYRLGRIVTTTAAERAASGSDVAVYGRAGLPCPRCGAALRAARSAGRDITWCPGCQV